MLEKIASLRKRENHSKIMPSAGAGKGLQILLRWHFLRNIRYLRNRCGLIRTETSLRKYKIAQNIPHILPTSATRRGIL